MRERGIGITITLIGLLGLSGQVLAHGQNPSTCPDRYDAAIASLSLIVDGDMTVIDPSSVPTIKVSMARGYAVMLTLKTEDKGGANTMLPGTTWYSTTAYGFGLGHCVAGVHGNESVSLNFQSVKMGQAHPGLVQDVSWGSLEGPSFRYRIAWQ